MAKITAVIDIGSNSVRMIICQKSSRFAFNIIYEAKSRVRISEGCYENGMYLQEKPMQRATEALNDFLIIAKNFKARKILCVATSAVRDAKNRSYFINKIKRDIGINIKVIDGSKEAYLGGNAAKNLLPFEKSIVTIDIGGGSTELAKIENGQIINTISLKIGTIRLKELFFDKKINFNELEQYMQEQIKNIPEDFKVSKVIAIGGTARAISKMLMPKDYPLKTLHAYAYDFLKNRKLLKKISTTDILKLKKYNIKKHRIDTFREGVGIFISVLDYLGVRNVITSGVGVREGLYLKDLLRHSNDKFPENFNPSLRNLCDRFLINEKYANSLKKTSLKIFDALKELHNIDEKYKKELATAAKLSSIGVDVNYYRHNEHSFYLILNSLNYGYTHSQKLLIAFIALYQNKKLPQKEDLKIYLDILPDLKIVKWLSFILSLAKCLHINFNSCKFDFEFKNNLFIISSNNKNVYLAKECIKELYKPFPISISLN